MNRIIKIWIILCCIMPITCGHALTCDFLRPVAAIEKKDGHGHAPPSTGSNISEEKILLVFYEVQNRVADLCERISDQNPDTAILPPVSEELKGRIASFRWIHHSLGNAFSSMFWSRKVKVGDVKRQISLFLQVLDGIIKSLETEPVYSDIKKEIRDEAMTDFRVAEMTTCLLASLKNGQLNKIHLDGMKRIRGELTAIFTILGNVDDETIYLDIKYPGLKEYLRTKIALTQI